MTRDNCVDNRRGYLSNDPKNKVEVFKLKERQGNIYFLFDFLYQISLVFLRKIHIIGKDVFARFQS